MAKQPNFLLGYGERLTAPVQIERGMAPSPPPYSFQEARSRLVPMVRRAVAEFVQLPATACPDDYAVGLVTLHPEYIAKSYFPSKLLREVGMETVGSRPCRVTPEKWRKKGPPEEIEGTQLFVAGSRADFAARSLSDRMLLARIVCGVSIHWAETGGGE